jgi:hypothetical protein
MTRPVLIAATIPAPYMRGDQRLWASWLDNAQAIEASHTAERGGTTVWWLAVCEGPSEPFVPLVVEVYHRALGRAWSISLDDGRTEITTANRQRHIVMCQNLAADRAWELGADLFMVGAGISLPPDVLPKLLELRAESPSRVAPLVGPYVPSYAVQGSPLLYRSNVPAMYGLPAGAVLVPWQALDDGLRWLVSEISDDYRLMHDAETLGYASMVRTDCIATKYPETVIPVEDRPADLRRL